MPLVGLFTSPMRNRDRYSLHPPTLRDLTVVQYVVCPCTCKCMYTCTVVDFSEAINQAGDACMFHDDKICIVGVVQG